jgi:glutathione-regulated potassium-efflux system ancillary protein KefG
MAKVLVLFAHPALERSRIHRVLIEELDRMPGVTFRDLYQLYPDFYIDVAKEQEMLLQHDLIIWQHPLYWYSVPPLLKQWIDLTLEHGWAYGSKGVYLRGKHVMNVLTAGGSKASYCAQGHNEFTITIFMRPLEQTARLCGMHYLPPYVVHGTHALRGADIAGEKEAYHTFLSGLVSGSIAPKDLTGLEYANDLLTLDRTTGL